MSWAAHNELVSQSLDVSPTATLKGRGWAVATGSSRGGASADGGTEAEPMDMGAALLPLGLVAGLAFVGWAAWRRFGRG